MKVSKINRKMLVGTLAVLSLLLLTGYTFVVAQSENQIENSPMFKIRIRTANAIDNSVDVKVAYVNQNTEDTMNQFQATDESKSGTDGGNPWSWMFNTCQGQWTCSGSSGVTCQGGFSCGATPCTNQGQSTCQGSTCHQYASTCAGTCFVSCSGTCGSTYGGCQPCIGPAPPIPPKPIDLMTTELEPRCQPTELYVCPPSSQHMPGWGCEPHI